MKIAFTGTHCTGKTTILEELKKDPKISKKFMFAGNISRGLKQDGRKMNEDGDDASQLLVMSRHLENFTYTNSILDRCALDGVVYTHHLFNLNKVSKNVLRIAETIFKNLKYDILFYFKPEFELVDDGTRSLSLEFQKKIADLFEEYISTYRIQVIPVTGTIQERVKKVKETINLYEQYKKEAVKAEDEFFKMLDKKLIEQISKLNIGETNNE